MASERTAVLESVPVQSFSRILSKAHMSESIPLRPTLSIQLVEVVVGFALHERLDRMHELLAAKCRPFGDVERETVGIVNTETMPSERGQKHTSTAPSRPS